METRLKVLRLFKVLHRTRKDVFKDDITALTASRLKINDEFRKNRKENSIENINKMIQFGSDVEVVLRKNVIQGVHIEDKILLRPRESLLLENVPYCDKPRNKT